MEELDLDALRAARAEQNGTQYAIRLGGKRFKLPPELPFDSAIIMAEGDLMGALGLVLSESDFKRFRALRPTVPDMTEIAEYLQEAYGKSSGESSASETS